MASNRAVLIEEPEMEFRCLHVRMDNLKDAMRRIIEGEVAAILIKQILDPDNCLKVFENFKESPGLSQRVDGVPARIVGANTFLKSPDDFLREFSEKNGHAELLFKDVPNIFRALFDVVEDAGYRFRNAYVRGIPAPTHRGTIWNDSRNQEFPLKPHTDWPQVHLSEFEYNSVKHPIAVNFYPIHPARGDSILKLYNFVPTKEWLHQRGIEKSGYPIDPKDLSGMEVLDIEPESGDMLLFNSSFVHAVHSKVHVVDRLNINGFLGQSAVLNRVIAWA